MGKIRSEIAIGAPKDVVWNVLADFGNIYRWNPSVKHSRSLTTHPGGPGAARQCDLENGACLKERITRWNEGESMEIEIYDSSLPLESSRITFEIVAEGAGKTKVVATAVYAFKFGIIGKLMDAVVGRRMYQSGFDSLLLGLKHHVETGEEITQESFQRVRATQASSA